jgi:peptide deformylase
MSVKPTTQIGNPIIRAKAKPVKDFSSKVVQKTINDLIDSMRQHDLVGMAAPQVGVSLRIFITEIRNTKHRKPKDIDILRVFINPKIISYSKRIVAGYEGCGSVASANLFGKVNRPDTVVVKACNEKGEEFELKAKGLLARVIQHEYDHIEGRVFLDKLTDKKSLMSGEEYMKMKKRKK